MKIISYYIDRRGVLFQIIRSENSIEINKVVDDDMKETQIIIGELVEQNILSIDYLLL